MLSMLKMLCKLGWFVNDVGNVRWCSNRPLRRNSLSIGLRWIQLIVMAWWEAIDCCFSFVTFDCAVLNVRTAIDHFHCNCLHVLFFVLVSALAFFFAINFRSQMKDNNEWVWSTIDDNESNSTTHLINYISAENEVISWLSTCVQHQRPSY